MQWPCSSPCKYSVTVTSLSEDGLFWCHELVLSLLLLWMTTAMVTVTATGDLFARLQNQPSNLLMAVMQSKFSRNENRRHANRRPGPSSGIGCSCSFRICCSNKYIVTVTVTVSQASGTQSQCHGVSRNKCTSCHARIGIQWFYEGRGSIFEGLDRDWRSWSRSQSIY